MSRPTVLITLAVTTSLCVLLFARQQTANASLRQRIEVARSTTAPEGAATFRDPETIAKVSRKEAAPSDVEEARIDPTRVSAARRRLCDCAERLTDVDTMAAFFAMLPEMVEALDDLSVDELIQLASDKPLGEDDASDLIAMIPIALAAELAPLRLLEDESLLAKNKNSKLEVAAFAVLARQEPEIARDRFLNSDLGPEARENVAMLITVGFAKRGETEAMLSFLGKLDPGNRMWCCQSAAGLLAREDGRDAFLSTLENEPDLQLRMELSRFLVSSVAMREGIGNARELVSRLPLGSDKREEIIGSVAYETVNHHPKETAEWILSDLGDTQIQQLQQAVRRWAQSDHVSAAEWLGELEPSTAKDASISAFATQVIRVDPEAALTWIDQIGDAKLQRMSQERAFRSWASQNGPAAEAWLEAKGMSPEEWLGQR